MGRKATSYLIYVVTIYSTLAIAVFSIIARLASHVEPSGHWFMALLTLCMLPLLVLDVLFLLFWIAKRKLWLLAPLIAIVVNIGFITAIFQFPSKTNADVLHNFKVATYNVHSFKHGNFAITVETIARFIKQEEVDVFCIQEFQDNPKFTRDSILRMFDFMPYFYSPYNHGGSDLALFSKYPIVDSALLSFNSTDNSALWIDVMVGDKKLKVVNAHFQTTNINQSKNEIQVLKRARLPNEQDQEALQTVANRLHNNFVMRAEQVSAVRKVIDNADCPVVVCGDFNDTPASYVYRRMTETLTDGFKSCGSGYAYSYKEIGKLLRIDYILYSKGIEGVRYYSPSEDWSDHNPVLLEFVLGD